MTIGKAEVQCKIRSEKGWICNLLQGHSGEVHVAIGLNSEVLEVWKTETITKTVDNVLFLKEAE